MIIVPLMGGLGNQMFQYAFGRGISEATGRRLVLDLTMLPTGSPPYARSYGLGGMSLSDDVRLVGRFGQTADSAQPRPLVARLGRDMRRGLRRWTVTEPRDDIRLNGEDLPRGVAICVGYWQSPHYFDFIAEDIRRELTPDVCQGGAVNQLLDKTEGSGRIAVHVRRGDYAAVSHVREFHGLQSAGYYEGAVAEILRQHTSPMSVIVLSEDPDWCAANLRFAAHTIYAEAENPLKAREAIALMSRCDAHVISNSSLSWWGAWLSGKSAQQVLYPSQWFSNHPVNHDFRFPASWRAFPALLHDGG